jgi:hypothetical protein
MHIYGYETTDQPIDTIVPASLAEIPLSATPGELRRVRALAAFRRGACIAADSIMDMPGR